MPELGVGWLLTHIGVDGTKVRILYIARAVAVAVLALLGAALLALSGSMTATVQLLATYAIKGTQGGPYGFTSDEAIAQQAIRYISGFPNDGLPHNVPMPVVVVQYPASSSNPPFDQSVAEGVLALQGQAAGDTAPVIYGFSQGAVVAGDYKKAFNTAPTPGTTPMFYLTGNPNRPNGGAFTRSGVEGATPTETAGAAPGQITTYDIAGEYDPAADQPTNPFNLLAMINASPDANNPFGGLPVHLNYPNVDPSKAVLQGTHGDTAYYMIPTYPLPLLVPISRIPLVGQTLTDVMDPFLRVLVEAGYDRTANPGVPAGSNPLYFPNPVNLGISLLRAIPAGLSLGLQDVMGGRQAGTAPSYLTGPDAVYSVRRPTGDPARHDHPDSSR